MSLAPDGRPLPGLVLPEIVYSGVAVLRPHSFTQHNDFEPSAHSPVRSVCFTVVWQNPSVALSSPVGGLSCGFQFLAVYE